MINISKTKKRPSFDELLSVALENGFTNEFVEDLRRLARLDKLQE
ncbi:hypothetical protein HDC90_001442 [Pedobacter sp. AK013]|nr:hypothetical protein [Pedobacter sp. AK013]MBB6236827.1 hypothetical protein [Pedobacter sp. AK013]